MYYDDKKMDFTDKMTVNSRRFSPSSGNGNGKGTGLRISIFLHSRFENNSFRHYIREFVCDCQPCNMSERGGRMENRETWSGNFGFIMATIGSAIGLGNVWKFPYITGMNGGGAFVIVYIICVLLLGVPVMICEMNIGRKTGLNAYGAYKRLELRRSRIGRFIAAGLILGGLCLMGAGSYGFGTVSVIAGLIVLKLGFAAFGLLAIFGALVILSYYAVVGGWILDYMYRSFSGNLNYSDVASAGEAFGKLTESPWRVSFFYVLFMILCGAMLLGGVRDGIEKWSRILMPLLFFLLIAVIIRSVTLPGSWPGVKFFLEPDFSKLTAGGVLMALGQCFYSLSLGMGITVTYGSYMKKNQDIFAASFWVMVLDTLAAVLSGLAIFPAVFAMGFNPGDGPSLIFKILPATFHHFPGGTGWLWGGLFFLMLTIGAVTSGVALLQNGVSFFQDQLKWSRMRSIAVCFCGVTLFGFLSSMSVANWKHIPAVKSLIGTLFGAEHVPGSFFDMLDNLTSNWMLPIGGMVICLFVGWVWTARKAARELRLGASKSSPDVNLISLLAGFRGEPMYKTTRDHGLTLISLWAIIIRFFAPVVILLIFLRAVGVNVGF